MSSVPAPVLALREVTKSYGKMPALRGVTLELHGSEIVGLLGPNGAGKSTLFQLAAGLFAPDGGTVELFGLNYRTHAPAILSRLGVVFQSRSIDLDMTVRANLAFHGQLFGMWGKGLGARIDHVTELLGLQSFLKQPVRTLSGGNQRRVEIARALINAPDLLLMDEPSTGLDATTRRLLLTHVGDVRRNMGTSILWATHLVDEVENADRVAILVDGKISTLGTPGELIARSGTHSLTDAYVALAGPSAEAEEAEGRDL
jgi:ABC-2 type transport system ATP-binding protein